MERWSGCQRRQKPLAPHHILPLLNCPAVPCPAAPPTPSPWQGYANPRMERLRQGIGPEDIGLVETIAPQEVPGLLREELPQLKE